MVNKIMFIDDEPGVLEALTWTFVDEPYEFFSFQSPLQALKKMEETEFSLVVTDQRMPEMEGTVFLEKIKQKWPDTVRMLITAYQELDIAMDAINKGSVFQLIHKPWDEMEIKQAVKNAVAHYESTHKKVNLQQPLKEENELLTNLNQSLEIKHNYLMERLQRAHKMETLGNLASGIAHDFKNILFIINGYLDLAMLEPSCTTNVQVIIEKALQASDRAKDLTSQILSFSRKNENTEKSIRVAPLIKDALVLIRSALPANIKIHQDIEANTAAVRIDPTKLYQIIINLCANASEAMEEGGILQVTLSNEIIGEVSKADMVNLTPGPYVRLTVSDNGIGISPGSMKQIFDPFFTTKEKSGGTGLGLALVDQIVKNHGGMITVQSEFGKGSEFHVYLPLKLNRDDDMKNSIRVLN